MEEGVIKSAADRDPNLKRLKHEKHQWQLLAKLIIAKLQAFKKGMGGKGDEETHLPPVSINESFPQSYAIYLDSIAEDYINLIGGAKQIMENQSEFASSKGKKEPRRDMMRELAIAASYESPELVAEASWWGSRMWARVSLMRLEKEQRVLRLVMIDSARDSIKDLRTIESMLLDKDEDSVAEATKEFLKFAQLFNKLIVMNAKRLAGMGGAIGLLEGKTPETAPDEKPKEDPKPKDKKKPAEPKKKDEVVFRGSPPTPDLSKEWAELRSQLASVSSRMAGITGSLPDDQREKLQTAYGLIESELAAHKDKYDAKKIEYFLGAIKTLNDSLDKIEADLKAKVSFLIDDDIQKLAQNVMTRWIKRKMMSISPTRQEHIKLDVMKDMHKLDDELDKLMNSLEDASFSNVEILKQTIVNRDLVETIGKKVIFLANNYYDYSQKPKLKKTHLTSLKNIMQELAPPKKTKDA